MDAYIIEARRTAIGRSHQDKGAFRSIRADELLAKLLEDFGDRVIPKAEVSDIYVGCVGQHLEQGKNIARLSALLAGYPDSVPGVTINRLCASSLQAFNFAAMAVSTGQADAVLAGGVEHMHHVPMAAAIDYNQQMLSRYEFPFTNMGLTAEKVAERYKVSRGEQDAFAVESHRRACCAQDAGFFDREILPVATPEGTVAKDQGPRAQASLEKLGELKTVFKENGTVTAGNCSSLNDGASLTLVVNAKTSARLGLKKRARVLDGVVVGLDPCMMGMGPVSAVRKLFERNKLNVSDIDFFEVNEAFASQAIACMRELELPADRVNPAGGAIALGHPLGATGTRLISTLLSNLEQRGGRLGVATLCIGHGQGMATLIERL